MKARTLQWSPLITLRAKSQTAVISAAAKQVAALQGTRGSDKVLVVYGHLAANVFCERPSAPTPRAAVSR